MNAEGGPVSTTEVENPPGTNDGQRTDHFNAVARVATGIVYVGSLIKMADVTDGTSNTYLLGEKYLCPDYYADGIDDGDNEDALMGDDTDICALVPTALSFYRALTHTASTTTPLFGSAHATAFRWPYATARCK